jgi:signal peptidase I
MLSKRVAVGLVAALAFGAVSLSPALADPPWKREGHHKHHGHYDRGDVVYVERPPVYVASRPRVVYVEPEPVYVWYPPPRPRVAYYPPPGVSVTFNFD